MRTENTKKVKEKNLTTNIIFYSISAVCDIHRFQFKQPTKIHSNTSYGERDGVENPSFFFASGRDTGKKVKGRGIEIMYTPDTPKLMYPLGGISVNHSLEPEVDYSDAIKEMFLLSLWV